MKILVIGGGGREHALGVGARPQCAREPRSSAPLGMRALRRLPGACRSKLVRSDGVLALALREQPALVVIGPEVPLAVGVVDALEERGMRVFGPRQAAAQLETSKAFAKQFMGRHEIPTAMYAVCGTLAEVEAALAGFAERVVVKADGLAAGKGVVLCATHAEAYAAAAEMLVVAGAQVVLEETLEGPEISYFAVCDGHRAVTLAFAQDHKRVGEGDTGPNTGGMGAYSTDDLVTPVEAAWMLESVAQRVVDGMRAEGMPFTGVLFTGFIMTADGPKVLEFNTRFGDPETEAIVLRLESELLDLMEAAVDGRVGEVAIRLKPGASACVIAASGGYPGAYTSGKVISGLGQAPDGVEIFHAGTAFREGEVVTAGGRVLAIAAAGGDLAEALGRVYGAMAQVSFEGMHFRRDIGWRALPLK